MNAVEHTASGLHASANPLPSHSISYRPDIDGLRAVAVLAVVIFHAYPPVLRGGFVGVDIFFVISGFLISNIILKNLDSGNFSFADFYSRRIRRIFPSLFIVLLATLGFGWVVLFPDELQALGKHTAGGAGFISNLLFWQESGYFDSSAESKPLLHLWSLGIEEQFYIFFPLFMYVGWKKKLNLLKMTLILLGLSFICNIVLHKADPIANFYSPVTRFWELLFGVSVAVATHQHNDKYQLIHLRIDNWLSRLLGKKSTIANGQLLNNILSILGLILVLIAVAFTKTSGFPGFRALIPVVGAMFLIMAGPEAIVNKRVLSCKLLVSIGLISYPLYLWHWPMFSYAYIFGENTNILAVLSIIIMAVLFSYLTYRFVERPIRFGNNSNPCKRAVTPLLVVLVAAVAVVGCYIYLANGLPQRGSIAKFMSVLQDSRPAQMPGEHGSSYDMRVPKESMIASYYTDAGGASTVALIGDSHAQCAYPGVSRFNAAMGVNTFLLVRQGWTPLQTSKKATQQNIKTTELMIEILSDRQDIDKVFILSVDAPYWISRPAEPNNPSANAPLYEDFSNGLRHLVTSLSSAGKQVFVVLDNPELPKHIRQSLPRALKSSNTVFINTRDEYMQRHRLHVDVLQSVENATFVDSLDAFCPVDDCRIFDDSGRPMYFDDNHLSNAGSDFLTKEVLAPYLSR